MDFIWKLFDSDFMPHGHCYFWKPEIVWTNAISDSIIATAYFTIPLSIVYIVKARKDFKYYWLLILFAIFILGCGATHVMDVINIWEPIYRLDSAIRVVTALASIGTAITLVKLTPQILLIPNADVFKDINEKLQVKISLLLQTEEELKAVQEELAEANVALEYKVQQRTEELLLANNKLVQRTKELEESEKRLKESEERFRAIADNIPNLAWMANADGHITWYNTRWYDYTGTNFQEMEGWGWKSVQHPNRLDEVTENWIKSIESGEPFEMVVPLKSSNGIYYPFLTRVVPIKDTDGNIVRWFGTNTDITELKKAEEILEKQNRELIKINSDLDNFIYTASHDLKAPISNIEGLIVTIPELVTVETTLSEDFQKIMKMISKAIDKFKNTIQDLSDVVKVQRNLAEDKSEVDICEIIEETKVNLSKEIAESGAVILTDLDSCPSIQFSKTNFRSVIYNLLSNSLKYKKPDVSPLIEITAIRTTEYIIITVKDNGLGIPAEKINSIFGMFKRLHDHVEGTGIGLYMVKRIIDNAGGKIEVESELGKGTIFKCFFRPDY